MDKLTLTPELFSECCPSDIRTISMVHALSLFLKKYGIFNSYKIVVARVTIYLQTNSIITKFDSYVVKRFFNVYDNLMYDLICLSRFHVVSLFCELFPYFKPLEEKLLEMIVPEIDLDTAKSMLDLTTPGTLGGKFECLPIRSICTHLGVGDLTNKQICGIGLKVERLWQRFHNKSPQKTWAVCPDGKTRFIKVYPETFQPYIKKVIETYKEVAIK